MLLARYSLRVARCLLCVAPCLLLFVCYTFLLVLVVRGSWFDDGYSLFDVVARSSLIVVPCVWYVACCALRVVRCSLLGACCIGAGRLYVVGG